MFQPRLCQLWHCKVYESSVSKTYFKIMWTLLFFIAHVFSAFYPVMSTVLENQLLWLLNQFIWNLVNSFSWMNSFMKRGTRQCIPICFFRANLSWFFLFDGQCFYPVVKNIFCSKTFISFVYFAEILSLSDKKFIITLDYTITFSENVYDFR